MAKHASIDVHIADLPLVKQLLADAATRIKVVTDIVAAGIVAFEHTREYVGEEMLPAVVGWSWFDWVNRATAALASDQGEPAVPPTSRWTVDDYRNAPSGQGPLAREWRDKPHRLVYDLAAMVQERDARRDTQPNPELVVALETSGLLRSEYPDDMARRSCTCTPNAVCGAHRLLARYGQLYRALQDANAEKRKLRAALVREQPGEDTDAE